jgi:hypothetical protein
MNVKYFDFYYQLFYDDFFITNLRKDGGGGTGKVERWGEAFYSLSKYEYRISFFTKLKNSISILVEFVSFDLVLHMQKLC